MRRIVENESILNQLESLFYIIFNNELRDRQHHAPILYTLVKIKLSTSFIFCSVLMAFLLNIFHELYVSFLLVFLIQKVFD